MAQIDLELIAHGAKQTLTVALQAHVQKYIERFIYTNRIDSSSIPIAYIESDPLDSWRNVHILDHTFVVPFNHLAFIASQEGWVTTTSRSYTSPYRDIAATNVTTLDRAGNLKPLFFRHDLPENTIQVDLYTVENGNRINIEDGYLVDLDQGTIFTNYKNYFNPDTVNYKLFFVVSVTSNGTSTHTLLSPTTTAREASWEDIDLDTGILLATYPLFTSESIPGGYTYTFNQDGPWYIRPIETSTIRPLLPSGREPEDTWFVRFSNGEFTATVNDKLRRYYIPEFDRQAFSPSKPYIYSTYRKMLWVNEHILCSTRDVLAIVPDNHLHFILYIYDQDDNLIRVLSTDTSLEGTRYSNTDILIETDQIVCWDNLGGFVALGININPNWKYFASYYYEAHDYEFSLKTLNPLQNKQALDYLWVYYIIPDVDEDDRAIHLLGVDKSGKIVYTSQSLGRTYPNLQMLNDDDSVNSDTIIGTAYRTSDNDDTFIDLYSSQGSNDYGYYILAEVVVLDNALHEDLFTIDVSRTGDAIVFEQYEKAIQANERILQSRFGYGEDGQIIPQDAVMVLESPITLLEDYGGKFKEDEVEKLLRTYLPAQVASVITWSYKSADLLVTSDVSGTVVLTADWQGNNLSYRFYRRSSPAADWILITEVENPPNANIVVNDTGLTSGAVYYYSVRIVENEIELPNRYSVGIRVR